MEMTEKPIKSLYFKYLIVAVALKKFSERRGIAYSAD